MEIQTDQSRSGESFFFFPFTYGEAEDYRLFTEELDQEENRWFSARDPEKYGNQYENRYFLNYVANKVNPKNLKELSKSQCRHFILSPEGQEWAGLHTKETVWRIEKNRNGKKYDFTIEDVHLFVFSTAVGILAYHVSYPGLGLDDIAGAEYYLRRSGGGFSGNGEKMEDESGKEELKNGVIPVINGQIFLRASRKLMKANRFSAKADFFFYEDRADTESNVLTLADASREDQNIEEVLYCLRHCYRDGFSYYRNPEREREEVLQNDGDRIWGITPEACVCVTYSWMNRGFLQEQFPRNFRSHYLFLYILLLHQKYVLYLFLTKISRWTDKDDLEQMEQYRKQLYHFEQDFAFSRITEVPQYESLYERISKAFGLEALFHDVHDPIRELSKMRAVEAEKREKEADEKTNKALNAISGLAVFSALVDSYDFFGEVTGIFESAPIVFFMRTVSGFIILFFTAKIIKLWAGTALESRKQKKD